MSTAMKIVRPDFGYSLRRLKPPSETAESLFNFLDESEDDTVPKKHLVLAEPPRVVCGWTLPGSQSLPSMDVKRYFGLPSAYKPATSTKKLKTHFDLLDQDRDEEPVVLTPGDYSAQQLRDANKRYSISGQLQTHISTQVAYIKENPIEFVIVVGTSFVLKNAFKASALAVALPMLPSVAAPVAVVGASGLFGGVVSTLIRSGLNVAKEARSDKEKKNYWVAATKDARTSFNHGAAVGLLSAGFFQAFPALTNSILPTASATEDIKIPSAIDPNTGINYAVQIDTGAGAITDTGVSDATEVPTETGIVSDPNVGGYYISGEDSVTPPSDAGIGDAAEVPTETGIVEYSAAEDYYLPEDGSGIDGTTDAGVGDAAGVPTEPGIVEDPNAEDYNIPESDSEGAGLIVDDDGNIQFVTEEVSKTPADPVVPVSETLPADIGTVEAPKVVVPASETSIPDDGTVESPEEVVSGTIDPTSNVGMILTDDGYVPPSEIGLDIEGCPDPANISEWARTCSGNWIPASEHIKDLRYYGLNPTVHDPSHIHGLSSEATSVDNTTGAEAPTDAGTNNDAVIDGGTAADPAAPATDGTVIDGGEVNPAAPTTDGTIVDPAAPATDGTVVDSGEVDPAAPTTDNIVIDGGEAAPAAADGTDGSIIGGDAEQPSSIDGADGSFVDDPAPTDSGTPVSDDTPTGDPATTNSETPTGVTPACTDAGEANSGCCNKPATVCCPSRPTTACTAAAVPTCC